VQSAERPNPQTGTPGGVTVGGGITCGSTQGTNVVSFTWSDDLGANNASYVVEGSGESRRMVRRFCRNGTVLSANTVAPTLGAAAPQVTCTPDCTAPRRVTLSAEVPSGRTFTLTGTRRTS
jgi:hypothetical protein